MGRHEAYLQIVQQMKMRTKSHKDFACDYLLAVLMMYIVSNWDDVFPNL